jgi:hydrogenase maturation protein HypF
MASFEMCDRCRAEYEDPGDRRFHAQPNACPECGPRLLLLDRDGRPVPLRPREDPLQAAAAAISDGLIVAVKGIGGFHLACRAIDERAVAELRARKHREDKPFALMTLDLGAAEQLVCLSDRERALLCSPQRPIVLAPRRPGSGVAAAVAPGSPELGVMLAYSPIHHLLLADAGEPLVMTSGNVSDEPIAYEDEDGLLRLQPIADLFLTHDRPIETRTDDSVVRVVSGGSRERTAFVRRSRGYVPASIRLPGGTSRPLLACGAELKSTFCVAKGERAWVSHHIGDLKNYETLRSFSDGIAHFERLFSLAPELVAHDLHPDYLSTRYALERDGVEPIGVQHHHAHLAACLAEHGEDGPAVGAIFDGSGYGTDGTVWGGEFLLGDLTGFERVGHLLPVRLPGGDRAVSKPWRMACAWMLASGEREPPAALAGVEPRAWAQVSAIAESGLASPLTTSIGRLFDAVAALCGIRTEINYEGQAAIELEAACAEQPCDAYPLAVTAGFEQPFVLDPRETIAAILTDLRAGIPISTIAGRFHAAIATATAAGCARAASSSGTELVVLSGGVFLNRRLLELVTESLQRAGLRVLVPEQLPPGDGGIAYGQAAVAAATLRGGISR